MIKVDGSKKVNAITAFSHIISKVVHAGKIIWESVRSCFGSGVWISTKPWLDKELWKNTR